ncbi:hypothetical protein ACI2OX_12445 [Bacillus sp. N9]
MQNWGKILAFFLLFMLVACSNDSIKEIDLQETESEIEVTGDNLLEVEEIEEVPEQRELTEEDQKYTQLLIDEQYDEIIEATKELSDDDPLKDYYFLASAFNNVNNIDKKIDGIDSELIIASIYKKQYGDIIDYIEKVQYIPEQLEMKVYDLNELAISEYNNYAGIAEKRIEENKSEYAKERNAAGTSNTPKTVSIGMTKEEVLTEGWGRPKKINKTTTANGTNEQWVYDNYNYLYFEDGILIAIQN